MADAKYSNWWIKFPLSLFLQFVSCQLTPSKPSQNRAGSFVADVEYSNWWIKSSLKFIRDSFKLERTKTKLSTNLPSDINYKVQ